jgi:CBS-domain-containing membrane protein
MNATVKDVMTTRVVFVRQDATYKNMAAELREHHISGLPVLDDEGKVVGLVSEADLLAKEALDGEIPGRSGAILSRRERARATGETAADLMTRPPITITADDSVVQAARLMQGKRVKRLPVVAADGHLIGIVSRVDVLSVYGRPDGDIKLEITETVILGTILTDPARFTVTVKDGIVTIAGEPETRAVGRDIIDSIRHVGGVVAVRDRLSYPPVERSSSPRPLF